MKKKELEEKVKYLEQMIIQLLQRVHELEKKDKPKYFG